MKKTFIFILYLASFIPCLLPPIEPFEGRLAGAGLYPTVTFAVEVAPRITDREIIEKLSGLDAKIDKETANIRGDIKELKAGQNALQQQITDTNRRIDDLKESTNKRFDILQWMFGLFITIALVILGFVLLALRLIQRIYTGLSLVVAQ